MKHLKKFEEHLQMNSGWLQAGLSKARIWWNELDGKTQKELCKKYLSSKCEGNVKYYPSDKEVNTIWEGESVIEEGQTFKATKKPFEKKPYDPDKKVEFRKKLKDHIKSKGMEMRQNGDDLEVMFNHDILIQVMFRESYIGVRGKSDKFVTKFEYSELGKVKSMISDLIKNRQ